LGDPFLEGFHCLEDGPVKVAHEFDPVAELVVIPVFETGIIVQPPAGVDGRAPVAPGLGSVEDGVTPAPPVDADRVTPGVAFGELGGDSAGGGVGISGLVRFFFPVPDQFVGEVECVAIRPVKLVTTPSAKADGFSWNAVRNRIR